MTYHVHFEPTPNPATLKFVVEPSIATETHEYKDVQASLDSPLANKLFGFPWTAGVMIGPNFIAVTKQDWVDWDTLADPLTGLIQEHLERGEPIISERKVAAPTNHDMDPNDPPDVAIIKKILNEEIRPAVAMDGGDVLFDKFENNVVYLHMRGSCSGCPSSVMTLKMGIETRLKEAVPTIADVVSV